MLFSTWLRYWKRSIERRWALNRIRRPRAAARRVARRLCLEALEDRTLLSPYLVTTTADSGAGSLRDAITQINADTSHTLYASPSNPNVDEIDFKITAASDTGGGFNSTTGVATIKPLSALPAITNAVILNGYSQSLARQNNLPNGDNAVLRIELNGVNVPGTDYIASAGLVVNASSSTVEGLAINSFGGSEIYATGNNDNFQGNFIGTDVSGTTTSFVPNLAQNAAGDHAGIQITGSNNVIGTNGDGVNDPAERNVIAGENYGIVLRSTTNSVVAGNFIGTDATGTHALANWIGIGTLLSARGDRIGTNGTDADVAGESNIICGNAGGIAFGVGRPGPAESNGLVAGNSIGVDVNGNPLGNTRTGIFVGVASSTITIGGNQAALANTIANTQSGPGVWIVNLVGSPTGIRVQGNSIHDNAGLGIALGGSYPNPPTTPLANDSVGHVGPNDFQNFPTLISASSSTTSTSITGTFSEAAEQSMPLTLDFYANSTGSSTTYGQGQTYLGSRTVITDASGNVSFNAAFALGNLAGDWISATATDSNGNTSEFSQDIQAASASSQTFTQILPAALPQSTTSTNTLTIQANTTTINDVVTALSPSNLGSSVVPVSVYLNLAPGTYNPTTVQVPAGMTLYINGKQGTTIDPALAAFTLLSGTVVISNVTFVTTGDAPTILVTGGNLTLRNDTIQESTGFTDAAISITGGTVDLGTVASPGGNTLNVNGAGEFVHNTTANAVSAVGDTFKVNGTTSSASTLSFTALTSSAATSPPSPAVKLMAVVRANGSSSTPTGSVDFFDSTTNTDLGGATLSGGNATLVTSALTAGSHVIVATYSGDTSFLLSLDTLHLSIPTAGAISAPLTPVAINTTINTSASFTDAISSNTHTAVWNWGDGNTSNGTVSESNGAGTVTGSHAYSVDGVYTVTLTVTNNQGGSGQSVFNYVVVFNPSAGFVTGGGWFNSPAGAYPANPTLTGKANFGLNAKYQSGSTVPTGNTEFQFSAANLDLKSTSYDWLVINGNQAQYQGSGTINGAGNYGFLVTMADNDASSGGGVDTLRIKIWDKNNNNTVIYDTQPGAANTATPTTPLGGGDIQVHANTSQASMALPITNGSPSNSTVVTDSILPNQPPAPAAPTSGAPSSATGWSAFGASVLGTLEHDLSQWEEAMTKELASLIQTVDQVFADWESAVLNPGDPATSR